MDRNPIDRRDFIEKLIALLLVPLGGAAALFRNAAAADSEYNPAEHYYGMGIQIDKCIGCGRCVEACKDENEVPREPFFFRTWVERYSINSNNEATVQNLDERLATGRQQRTETDQVRSFFVPKLCNQCDNPPCVQVCPVSATFKTVDGVILVDDKRCLGCRYCIQACPYGARYLHPVRKTADKCTFCYHRIAKGLSPACVEVCPSQARMFGDLRSKASVLTRFKRMNKLHRLKPSLNTEPKVFYSNLDGEVR